MNILYKGPLSRWAYHECLHDNNTKEIRDLITDSYWAWMYCIHIDNDDEVRLRILNAQIRKHINGVKLYKKLPEI